MHCLILCQISSGKPSAGMNGKSLSGGHTAGAGKEEAAVPFLTCPNALPGPSFLVLPSCQRVKLSAHASHTGNNYITVTIFIN